MKTLVTKFEVCGGLNAKARRTNIFSLRRVQCANVEETELSMHTTNFEGRVAEKAGIYKHNYVLTLYSRQWCS